MDKSGGAKISYPVEFLRPDDHSNVVEQDLPDVSLDESSYKSPPASPNEIIRHLQHLTKRHMDAVHARDFSSTSAIWQNKAPCWQAEIGMLSAHKMNLEEYVEAWKQLDDTYPHYRIVLQGNATNNLTTIELNGGMNAAKMYVPANVLDMPPGTTRPFVGVVFWNLIDGKWMSTKFTTLPGLQA